MERLMNKKFVRKIVLVILIILSLNFIAYPVNQADTGRAEDESTSGGVLAFPICFLVNAIADGVNYLFEYFLIGDDATAAVINGDKAIDYMTDGEEKDDPNWDYTKKAEPDADDLPEIRITRDAIKTAVTTYDVAVIKLTPAEIFAGNVAALDANFFDTSSILFNITEEDVENKNIVEILVDGIVDIVNLSKDGKLGGESIVSQIRGTIAGWYVSIRNIAIVGLL